MLHFLFDSATYLWLIAAEGVLGGIEQFSNNEDPAQVTKICILEHFMSAIILIGKTENLFCWQ